MNPTRFRALTWTDMMRLRETREAIADSERRLRELLAAHSNPIDIVQERIFLDGARYRERMLRAKVDAEFAQF